MLRKIKIGLFTALAMAPLSGFAGGELGNGTGRCENVLKKQRGAEANCHYVEDESANTASNGQIGMPPPSSQDEDEN